MGRFLPDGSVFDASNAPGRKPIAFKLGARQVIKGWEEVLRLMNVSERMTGGAYSVPNIFYVDALRAIIILRANHRAKLPEVINRPGCCVLQLACTIPLLVGVIFVSVLACLCWNAERMPRSRKILAYEPSQPYVRICVCTQEYAAWETILCLLPVGPQERVPRALGLCPNGSINVDSPLPTCCRNDASFGPPSINDHELCCTVAAPHPATDPFVIYSASLPHNFNRTSTPRISWWLQGPPPPPRDERTLPETLLL